MKLSETAEKIYLFVALVQRQITNIEFDARKALVPAQFIERESVIFQYGAPAVLVVPIPDLEITEEGVRATLSFGRLPFQTFVPWAAVIAMFGDDGRGKVWNQAACTSLSASAKEQAQPGSNVVSIFKNRS